MKKFLIMSAIAAALFVSSKASAFGTIWTGPIIGGGVIPIATPSLNTDPEAYEGAAKILTIYGKEVLLVDGHLNSAITAQGTLDKTGGAAALYHPTDESLEVQDNMECELKLGSADFSCMIPVEEIKLLNGYDLTLEELKIQIWLAYDYDVAGVFVSTVGELLGEKVEEPSEPEFSDAEYGEGTFESTEVGGTESTFSLEDKEIGTEGGTSTGGGAGGGCSMAAGSTGGLGFIIAFLALLPLAIGRRR